MGGRIQSIGTFDANFGLTRRVVSVDRRRGERRFVSRGAGRVSWHSFSFGDHYDPANTGFGFLLASNHEELAPGGGFDEHRHRDIEIVTWLISGELVHAHSGGSPIGVSPGVVQRLSAGSGVTHSERNASTVAPVEFVQMWIVPDSVDRPPDYASADVNGELGSGSWVPIVGGAGAPISIRQPAAKLCVARPRAGTRLELPEAGLLHLYVSRGSMRLADERYVAGDAARIVAARDLTLTAGAEPTELLVWAMTDRSERL